MNRIEYEKEIFGMLFKTANGLQVYLDQMLSTDKITAKQMFLMMVVASFDEHYPTLKEVAEKSSSSYQNVKQLALKLQREDYVEIFLDVSDRRKKNIRLTSKAKAYWDKRDSGDTKEIDRLFSGSSNEELKVFLKVIQRLQVNMIREEGI